MQRNCSALSPSSPSGIFTVLRLGRRIKRSSGIAFWSRSKHVSYRPSNATTDPGGRGSTVGDVYRKVMGDAPLAYAETTGGVKVAEDDLVAVGKNDVSCTSSWMRVQC